MRRLTITGRRLSTLFVASLVLGGAGCATGDTASVGDIDTGVPDVSDDGGGDGASVDTGNDAETGDGKCHTDGDCAHDPAGTACDTTTGKCVQCVPSKDWCPDGTYCDAKTNKCQTGCRTSLDCVAAPTGDAGAPDASSDASSDAGTSDAKSDAPAGDSAASDAISSDSASADTGTADSGSPLVCDPTTHQCVGCTDSSQCPLGALCDVTTNACYPGCTPTHGCPGTYGCCTGTCVDLNVSVSDCGTCGKACPKVVNGAAACNKGLCVIATCATGTSDCNGNFDDGCEINTTNDPANCSACGQVCSNVHGTPSCKTSKCAISCDPGYQDCDGNAINGCEINSQTDVDHCGTCATKCVKANDTPACNSGVCVVASCDTGYGDCDVIAANGCETNLNTSTTSCGKCNSPCSVANGTPACVSGKCDIASCKAGFDDCNADPTDGCETNINKDTTNCGKCGTSCVVANGTPACTLGACSISACGANYADCNKLATDGCEADTRVDKGNCGACGNVCNSTNGTASCVASACKIVCNAGFGDCDGNPANGCETNLNTSLTNCGTCAKNCSVANGTPACTAGACKVAACNTGFSDCNGNATDGCEVNTASDTANCGSCAKGCSVANATPKCVSGTCDVNACSLGFANCDGSALNGCEVNLTNDPSHCGNCTTACSGSGGAPTCSAGTCSTICASGYGDCNAAIPGCETQIAIDPNNCGTCGKICALPNTTVDTCVTGTCRIVTCSAGYADCNATPGDGCETKTNGNDVNNCGGCGVKCTSPNGTPSCTAGVCGLLSCNAGWGNCDGNATNGCETNTTNDVNNCNACGSKCSTSCVGNVSAVSCTPSGTTGVCTVTACASGYYDLAGGCTNGCECKAAGESGVCTAPTALGSIAVGAAAITTVGNLPAAGTEGWYSVTFTGESNTAYHPTVSISQPVAGEYVFDIKSNCSGGTLAACNTAGDQPTASALVSWGDSYIASADPVAYGGDVSHFSPIPAVGNGGTVLIRVYRAAVVATATCNSFTLTIKN